MLSTLTQITAGFPPWLSHIIVIAGAIAIGVALGWLAHTILFRILRPIVNASHGKADDLVLDRLRWPTRITMIVQGALWAARESQVWNELWERIAGFVMPALFAWIAITLLRAMLDSMAQVVQAPGASRDARRRQTRLAILARMATFLIAFVTVALMLFTIPGVRQIGATLIASAGLAALAVGAAAQPALKALIAGFQMALTEPIAIDDLVLIDGEQGRVEDIRTTYVIVRLWDERRLVVPTNRFLEQTFQNWTKHNPELLANVMLYLDPTADIAPIRAEFERQVTAHPKWDKRRMAAQVTAATTDSLELRLVMSAQDSGSAFDLRCDIREALLAWIRDNQPLAFVRHRTENNTSALDTPAAASPAEQAG